MAGNEMRGSASARSYGQQAVGLVLAMAPVVFSDDRVRIGRLDPEEHEGVRELRREHWRTHAFRFDSRDGKIANIGLEPRIDPKGKVENVAVGEHLLLFAEAIEQQLRRWLSDKRRILRPFRPLICLGDRDRLLTQALQEVGVKSPDGRLDVVAKWSFDLRLLASSDLDGYWSLGLIADVGTSNVIDIPVSELLDRKFDATGCYVGAPGVADDLTGHSRLRLIGRVKKIENAMVVLDDVRSDAESDRVSAADVFVEARREMLEAVTWALYPSVAERALEALRSIRAPFINGKEKFEKIRCMIDALNKASRKTDAGSLNLRFGDGLSVEFGELLDQSSSQFPRMVETSRPTMLFGSSGHEHHTQPDIGIREHGPFQYAHNPVNDPTIVVLCNKAARGRMEQFAKALRDGIDERSGRFSGGLIGKFRLTDVRFHFVEISSDTAEGYIAAVESALDKPTQTPAMALVQVREAHRQRLSEHNPYFVAKSRFMRAGVPVQAVRLETLEQNYGRTYTLNNLALGTYAKIGGTPWVISTRGVATHELVIGVGSTEIGRSRLGDRARYVGITTLFQGDGRYLVWETTKEATLESYPEALLESLRKSIRFVKTQNKWESGDDVRLVFHVYKPLKRVEIETVKQLVKEMLNDYPVEFAFLDVSRYHLFQIFDPRQKGVRYRSYEIRKNTSKGIYVPERGTALLLEPRTALLQLIGAKEVKTWEQGIPRPLLLELHADSDFSDLTYLVRQTFHFSFMSWRSFFPAHEPVTILYSRWIANMLGNMNAVPGWDSVALNQMRDRRAMWFL